MRIWSVFTNDHYVFTPLQSEALKRAKEISNTAPTIVFEHEVKELPRGELLAACLNFSLWDHKEWQTSEKIIAQFDKGKKK